MDPFKNILVDIDAMAPAHPALDRAANLARHCGARLKIVDVVRVPSAPRTHELAAVEQTVVKSRRDRLSRIAAGLKDVAATVEILMGRPALVIIQEVLKSGHDLVVRSHARDLVAPRGFGAVDMQLFRQCPCPVWAVTPGIGTTRPLTIVAAVNANREDEEEQKLNVKILEHALLMARLHQGSLVVLQAWVAFGEELVRSRYRPEELTAYVESAREAASGEARDLMASFGSRLEGVRLEVRKGDPEDVIPEFVVTEGADVVVMGTVARTGIPGLVIGNTAERVLQKLVCSVLAVKPDGFVSPVHLESE